MPVTVSLRFLAGRYHATGWRRHVNDEYPEWPPSPWRLLRALASVWKQKFIDDPVITANIQSLFGKLAAESPHFQLPQATLGHTRHYMPTRSSRHDKPTLVLDRFVAIDRREEFGQLVYVHWPNITLTDNERNALARLTSRLTYLGRAESWCDVALLSDDFCARSNCLPALGEASCLDKGEDTMFDGSRVLMPAPDSWRDWEYPTNVRKPDPAWNLLAESSDVQTADWDVPAGAKWVTYSLPVDALKVMPKPMSPEHVSRPTVARFLLDGPVLPLVTDTVRVAEAFRRAAMSRFRQWCERHLDEAKAFRRADKDDEFSSPILSGKELNGTIRTDHRHAYYLPTVGDDPRRIAHITLIAKDGFGAAEVAALSSLRNLKWGDGSNSLRVQLIGLGNPDHFNLDLFKASSIWESVTPFVVHRHYKQRGRKRDRLDPNIADPRLAFVQLAVRELIERSFDETLVAIERFEGAPGAPPAIDFRRYRDRRSDEARGRPFSFLRLKFAQPIAGPVAIGYGCHFGLGLFSAVD